MEVKDSPRICDKPWNFVFHLSVFVFHQTLVATNVNLIGLQLNDLIYIKIVTIVRIVNDGNFY